MRFILTALCFCLLAGSFTSCVSKKKYDELTAAKQATDAALAETQSDLKETQGELSDLETKYNTETTELRNEIQGVRDEMNTTVAQMNEKLSMTEAELQEMRDEFNGMFSDYQAAGLTMDTRDGELYLVTDTPFTFRSSSTSLTREERDVIDAMAEKIKDTSIRLLIEGHTDNKKFVAGAGRDNWDLSYARAKAVATRLIRAGVSPEQITLAGRGENDPIGDNSTSEGRAENRRTVIKPNPKIGGMMKAMSGEEGEMDN
jgi:chemotaxis protein MotB